MPTALATTTLALLALAFAGPPTGSPVQQPERGAAPAASELRFAWGAAGSVRVREVLAREGTDVEKSYVLRWGPREPDQTGAPGDSRGSGAPSELVLAFEDVAVERYGGRPASDPEVARALAQVAPVLEAMPRWRIGADGRFLGLVDVEASLERLVAAQVAAGLLDPEREAATARAMIADPGLLRSLEERSADAWKLWVGSWTGVEVLPGAETTIEREVEIGARRVPARTVVRCLKRLERDGAACVELSARTVLQGDAYVAAVEDVLVKVTGAGAAKVASARKEIVFDGVWEVATLKPREATSTVADTLTLEGGLPQRQSERHGYLFEWPKAEAPAPR